MAVPLHADPTRCGYCFQPINGETEYLTEVNAPGGYGRAQLLLCDACVVSDDWKDWRARVWPDWPKPRPWEKSDGKEI